jgi:chorismate dehydratase
VALLQILLAERYNLAPELIHMEPDLDAMLSVADAALIIGDPVFDHLAADLNFMDLGAEWTEWTALPFVYAFWAGRADALHAEDVAALARARVEGASSIPQIAADFARRCGGAAAVYEQYLTQNIQFSLGDLEIEGFQLFLRLAHQLDLIPGDRDVQFFPAAVPAHP